MSSRSLRGSCGIKQLPLAIDRLQEPAIGDGLFGDQVHAALKQVFQAVQQAEISVGLLGGSERDKLDEKIEIARVGPKLPARGGAEEFEPANMKGSAQTFQRGPLLLDQRQNSGR